MDIRKLNAPYEIIRIDPWLEPYAGDIELRMDRFKEKCGSYICNDLLGCDISTQTGVDYARANNLFTELCPQMVANAVDVLEEIINEYVTLNLDEK